MKHNYYVGTGSVRGVCFPEIRRRKQVCNNVFHEDVFAFGKVPQYAPLVAPHREDYTEEDAQFICDWLNG